jgi:hypothetical protein
MINVTQSFAIKDIVTMHSGREVAEVICVSEDHLVLKPILPAGPIRRVSKRRIDKQDTSLDLMIWLSFKNWKRF